MKFSKKLVVLCAAMLLLAGGVRAAWGATDFGSRLDADSAWLNKKTAGVSQAALKGLLADPVFRGKLACRRFVDKIGADNLQKFAGASKSNADFVAWVMRDADILETYLLGATPVGLNQRKADGWKLSTKPLEIWKSIYAAEPESRKGLGLKLAMAIGFNPPGTGNRGVGQADKPETPLARYKHFMAAWKNGELFPTFDKLTVWEYRQIVSSNASNADLAWGREMINTWRPDLRFGQKVVLSTGRVWRRGSPYGYKKGFRSVMEGGGKCGPRSSWAVFICQAFGVPATGVRQPGHVCVSWRSPSGQWMLAYGRGWDASKVMGMSGREFLAATEARAHASEFLQVERLRWLASAMESKERAGGIMAIAKKISRAQTPDKVELAGKFEPSRGLPINPKGPKFKPEKPIKAPAGVIHVEAEAFAKTGGQISYGGLQFPGVCVHNCWTGGKQIHFQAHMKSAWADYAVRIPKAGTYEVSLRVSAANRDQVLTVGAVKAKLPNTYGLWQTVGVGEIKLEKGAGTIRIASGFQRGVSLKWIRLKLKK